MKKYSLIFLTLVAGIISSCTTESTNDVSRVTNYPIITLNGDSVMFINKGDTFTDPGAVAIAGGAELPITVTVSEGTYTGATGVDTSQLDQYTITYSAENEDGFFGNALRTVWVTNTGDLTNSLEGLYTSSSQRAPDFAPSAAYNDMEYVQIWQTGANTYELSHAIGGYYDYGRGYGSGYAARGAVITVNDLGSNDFTISQAVFPIWGNTVDITEFTVDPDSKAITFTGEGNFGNGVFKVQLKQVQL